MALEVTRMRLSPPPSFQRIPAPPFLELESSGLYNTFPPSGNDNQTHYSSQPGAGRQSQAPLYTPSSPFLDSSFRRAATGILPSRRIQDILSINDDGVEVKKRAED